MVSPMHRTAKDDTAIRDGEAKPERLSYSVAEAAELIGISKRYLFQRIKEKKIQTYRDGVRRLISRRALEEYIAAREAESNEEAA